MQYLSTRDSALRVSAQEAIVRGLAPQSGLFVPETFPQADLDAWKNLSYPELAEKVLAGFLTDYSADFLHTATASTYGAAFGGKAGETVKVRDGLYSLELWHGPTCAFKDYALQLMPKLLVEAKKMLGRTETTRILVATSGDTGKAALAGYADLDGIEIEVFYPNDGTSEIQHLQMATQKGENVQVYAVQGNFDDAQTGVKKVFADADVAAELEKRGIRLSSANSINWGRLMPQIVYYLSAYAMLVAQDKISAGEPIDVCVPTGNFGNILAAYYAKRMGCPIEMLLCASNENRVLTDFINTGTYDISQREFVLTPSPSMDILVSSNLERQLFELTDRDPAAISRWMEDLNCQRRFRVDERTFGRLRDAYRADSIDNATCLESIKEVFERHDYLIDPHTAVAWKTAQNLRGSNPLLIASTAHWAKFGDNVYRALNGIAAGEPLPDEVAGLTGCQLNRIIAERTGSTIPRGLAALDEMPARFTEVIDGTTDAIKQAALDFSAARND